MNLTPEVLLGIITSIGVTLSGAITVLAKLMLTELTECKTDRKSLTAKTDVMSVKQVELAQEIGRMRGHFEFIDERNRRNDEEARHKNTRS